MSYDATNRRIYCNTGTNPAEGVSTEDVRRALGVTTTDLGTLCADRSVNPWARYKPIPIQHKADDDAGKDTADHPWPLTDSERRRFGWGSMSEHAYDTSGSGDRDIAVIAAMVVNGATDDYSPTKTPAQIEAGIANGWITLNTPLPNSWWRRLTDFVRATGTVGTGFTGTGYGYDHKAKAGTLTVHSTYNGAERLYSMAPVAIAPVERNIVIEDGQVMKIEIPDDFDFLHYLANSTDVQDGTSPLGITTDVLSENPWGLSPIEIILGYMGELKLIASATETGITGPDDLPMLGTAQRGVAVMKWDAANQRYFMITYRSRDMIGLSSGGQQYHKQAAADDLYYSKFAVTLGGSGTSSEYMAVTGSGTPTSTPLTDSRLEELAEELCFKRSYQTRSAEFTSWPSRHPEGALYGVTIGGRQLTAEQRLAAIARAKTMLYKAMMAANHRWLDLTRVGYSTGGLTLHTRPSSDAELRESENLVGELLVVEYYERWLYAAGVRECVVIPGYGYKINVSRVAGGMNTDVDVTGVIYFGGITIDTSGDAYIDVYLKTDVSQPDGSTLDTILREWFGTTLVISMGTLTVVATSYTQYAAAQSLIATGQYAGYWLMSLPFPGPGSSFSGTSAVISGTKKGTTHVSKTVGVTRL